MSIVEKNGNQHFGFDPRTVPGCQLWIDAADRNTMFSDTGGTTLATTGGTVVRVNDKSGFGNHTTARGGTTTLAANAMNGLSALSFDTSWFTGGFSSTYAGNQMRAFAVATLTTASRPYGRILSVSRPGIMDFNQTNTTFLFCRNTGQNLMVGRNSSYLTVNLPAYSTPFLATSGHAANVQSIGINGVIVPSTQNTNLSGNFNITSYGIGTNANSADTEYWSGFIGEVIYYTESLTTLQIQQIEGYLAWKWGLQANLPVAHPFKNNPTTMRIFQPIDIASCALWLDAADLSTISPANITSGTAITQWNDKSLTGTFAVPERGSSGVAPIFSNTAGVPSIFINNGGVNTNYSATTFAQLTLQRNIQTTQDYTVFAVINFNTVTNASLQAIYSNHRATVAESRSPNFGAGGTFEFRTSVLREFNGAFIGTGILQTCLTSSSNLFSQTRNGSAYLSVSSSPANRFTEDAGPFPTIGGTFTTTNGSDNRFTTGHFHEIILYNRALSSNERQQVEGYLAAKWRTPALPTTHPYFNQRTLPTTSLFDPNGLVNGSGALQPVLWLDAADASTLTTSGTTVTQWRDKSGNARHMNVGSGTTSYISNSVRLNNSYMFVSSAVNLQTFAFFIVCQAPTPIGGNQVVFSARPLSGNDWFSTDAFGFYLDSGQVRLYGTTSTGQSITNALTTSDMFMTSFMATSTGLLSSFQDGKWGGSAITSARQGSAQGFAIGASWANGVANTIQSTAYIYEILVYNLIDLSPFQRQQIEGYLAWKWGLQTRLPVSPTYTPASNGLFAIWLDAADASTFTLSGSSVSRWQGKDGNFVNFGQTNAANQPTRANNAVITTGNQFLININPNPNGGIFPIGGYDVFVVGKPLSSAATGTWRTLIRGFDSEHPIMVEAGTTRLGAYLGNGAFQQFGQAGQNLLTVDGSKRVLIYVNIPTSRVISASLDGVVPTSTVANGAAALAGTNFYALGNIQGGGQPWGEINEFIVVPNLSLASTRKQIEEYLARKWSLELPSPLVHQQSKFRP
jgi:hypothetical protein